MGYGIDIGSSTLKVVALARTMGGFKLVGAGRRRVPRIATPEDTRAVIAGLLNEAMGQNGTRVGVVGLTGRDINLQVVQQPKTTALNYRTLMRYEIEQRKGSDAGLYADWCTLREPDQYFPQYLAMVAVGKREYVDERLSTAIAARIEVRDAVPNAWAIYELYRANYPREDGAQLLLDIGADNVDMALVRGGRLVFARNVSTGARIFDTNIGSMAGIPPDEGEVRKIQYGNLGPPGPNADPREEEARPAVRTAAGQLHGVIQSSIQFAKTQLQDKEMTVDKIYISGGGARLRGLPEYLASALKTPVEPLDPFKKVDTKAADSVEDLKQLPSDMAVCVGLAMMSLSTVREGAHISIVPDVIRRRRSFMQGSFWLMASAAIVTIAMLVLTVSAVVRKSMHQAGLDEFTQKTDAISKRIEELDKLEAQQRDAVAKSQLLLGQTDAGRAALDVIAKLRKVLPDGVNVRKVEFIDLTDRPQNPVAKKRVVFHAPGRGLVISGVAKESLNGDLVLTTGEEFKSNELDEVRWWIAPAKGVKIEGEVDENIKGGAGPALDAIKDQLRDPSRGIKAEIPYQDASRDKPGWRVFHVILRTE